MTVNAVNWYQTLPDLGGQTNTTKRAFVSEPEIPTAPSTPTQEPSSGPITLHTNLPIHDIQQVAKQLGFLDISDKSIQKAYYSGESFLADYRA